LPRFAEINLRRPLESCRTELRFSGAGDQLHTSLLPTARCWFAAACAEDVLSETDPRAALWRLNRRWAPGYGLWAERSWAGAPV